MISSNSGGMICGSLKPNYYQEAPKDRERNISPICSLVPTYGDIIIRMNLLIIPVEYSGKLHKIEGVCQRVLKSFKPILTDYEIMPSIDFSEFVEKTRGGKCIENALDESRDLFFAPRFRFGAKFACDPLVDKNGFWIGEHLLLALNRYVNPGFFVLGLTSIPAIAGYKKNEFIYGMGDDLFGQVAFVSAGYPEFEKIDTEEYLIRITNHSLHELGHAMHLGHHRPFPDKNGKYCPMAEFTLQFIKKKGFRPADLVLKRRSSFCRRCSIKLKNPLYALKESMERRLKRGS